ncbi:SH3 domain-containing protein [Chloroflexota bacterium]
MKESFSNRKTGLGRDGKPALLLQFGALLFAASLFTTLGLGGCVLKTGTLPASIAATATEKRSPEPHQGQVETTNTPAPVDTATPAPTDTPEIVSVAIVNVDLINVHSGPALRYPVIAEITYGEVLRILGRNAQKTWLYVLIPDDLAGWILVEEVEGNFDLDSLPVIQFEPSPTPTESEEPYGGAILVPPDLDGIAPASARNPQRSALSLVAVLLLLVLVFAVYAVTANRRQPAHRTSLARLLQIIISLF